MPPVTSTPARLEDRILDAALELVGRWGLAKTSLGDVAREARCGRATLYRTFPGGKGQLYEELARRELHRFSQQVAARLDEADSLEDALVAAITESASVVAGHKGLQFLLAHEPGVVLPYLGFRQADRLYRAASQFAGPHLVRFLDVDQTPWAVEWVVRLVVSYLFTPADGVDLTRETDVRRLVRTYFLPALTPEPRSAAPSVDRRPTPPVPVTTGS